MGDNFLLFDKYPHYIFNFSGSNRYRFMKEYFPEDFGRLKQYVAQGRWFPAGSSVEEGDVNAPSAEAIIRQILYGNEWFREEFGKTSEEYMLPGPFSGTDGISPNASEARLDLRWNGFAKHPEMRRCVLGQRWCARDAH
jgi:alpha-mannosidase